MKKLLVIEEWGKIKGRAYHTIFYLKSDKRFKTKEKREYLKAEYQDELPYTKMEDLPITKFNESVQRKRI